MSLSENTLFLNSSLFIKNNARNIKYMVALVFPKCLDLRKMFILGQAHSTIDSHFF